MHLRRSAPPLTLSPGRGTRAAATPPTGARRAAPAAARAGRGVTASATATICASTRRSRPKCSAARPLSGASLSTTPRSASAPFLARPPSPSGSGRG
eukprot:6198769-Pleurochrysis_carterae.AAC.3